MALPISGLWFALFACFSHRQCLFVVHQEDGRLDWSASIRKNDLVWLARCVLKCDGWCVPIQAILSSERGIVPPVRDCATCVTTNLPVHEFGFTDPVELLIRTLHSVASLGGTDRAMLELWTKHTCARKIFRDF